MNRRSFVACLVVGALLAAQATAVGQLPGPVLAASATAVETRLLVATNLALMPPPPVALVVMTVSLGPGAATRPLVADGPIVLRVEAGALVATGLPVATLAEGDRLTIPTGARLELGNAGDDEARLLLVALMPQPT